VDIRILGTSAAEGWPALFCTCEACVKARKLGGRNLRTRSSLQIDDGLKIDFPPDSLAHSRMYGLDFSRLQYILFTHAHFDHLAPKELTYLIPPFALQDKTKSIRLFGSAECMELLHDPQKQIERDRPQLLNEITFFQHFQLGDYDIHTLKANHGTKDQSLNYFIGENGRYLLYASDTGLYEQETWDYLKGMRADLVIIECTAGPQSPPYKQHLGFPDVRTFRRIAEEQGTADEHTRWVLTHFSHVGGMLHDELQALTTPYGFTVAWDGMQITL
jgi:phosphoribosyl 1,2-cyclic phosphate phosphodiesterase